MGFARVPHWRTARIGRLISCAICKEWIKLNAGLYKALRPKHNVDYVQKKTALFFSDNLK